MTGLDIERAKVLLRNADLSVAQVAEELGISPRSLREHFGARVGMAPKQWRMADGVVTAEGAAQIVSFRLTEFDALAAAAERVGESPAEYARNIVRSALMKKRKSPKSR